ncbi:MAG: hypothetical protein WDM92_10205 [Caulobacteraceae bacterium]
MLAIAPASASLGATWPADRYARVAVQLLSDGGLLEGRAGF